MSGLRLDNPWWLLGLVAVAAAIWTLFFLQKRLQPRVVYPRIEALRRAPVGAAVRWRWVPPVLRVAALLCVVVALARPQSRGDREETFAEGIDIVLAFDISTSMRAADFKPDDRFTVAKQTIKEFVAQRKHDRIGIVIFAKDAFTQVPLTLDYAILQNVLRDVQMGVIEDGTAIGNAIAVSVNRLRDSTAKSKIIVLLTDGDNNAGNVAPLEATELARERGIRLYTIQIGKGGRVPYPAGNDIFGRQHYEYAEIPVNPELLRKIAERTGGHYYVAGDEAGLKEGFQKIVNELEKSVLPESGAYVNYKELFPALVWPAFALLVLEALLTSTRLRRFP